MLNKRNFIRITNYIIKYFKLIGIHIGYSKDKKRNLSLFIKYVMNKLNKEENIKFKKGQKKAHNINISIINKNSSLNFNTNNIPDIINTI